MNNKKLSDRIARIWIAVLLLLPAMPAFSQTNEIQLRVMTFNMWYGGEQVSFGQAVEEVRAANPDIIGIQEPDGNLRRLAQAAGYTFVDEKRNIISRYPLFDPDTDDQLRLYDWVQVAPGRVIAVTNTHLPSTPFGPDLLRDGQNVEQVLAMEKQIRMPDLEPYITTLTDLMKRDVPVIFTGDFNTPSHLDWTKETAAVRPTVRFPLDWPVTRALANAGLRDAYREIHPDPVKNPGITFTPGYPHPYLKPEEILDRIDMIWISSKITALACQIVGEAGNPAVDIAITPYPSDHRAVVATLRVQATAAPPLIAVDQPVFPEGEDFLVRFQTPGFADWGVVIVAHHGNPNENVVLSAKGPNLLSTRPTFRFGSLGIQPGAYDAILLDAKGKEIARTQFHILPKNGAAELKVERSTYKSGESIRVSWKNAPGMMHDWIGVYRAGDPDLYGGYMAYAYTKATVDGSTVLDNKVLSKPLAPGNYELRLMREDSYVLLAKTPFTITSP